MTTIAWDGKSMVADTRCTSSGMPYRVLKCCVLPNGSLFGGAGTMSAFESVRAWLSENAERPSSLKDFTGMLIDGNRRIWLMDETTVRYEILQEFYAIGSGRDFAIAAMALGNTALAAVELAARFDVWTGPPFTELKLSGAGLNCPES